MREYDIRKILDETELSIYHNDGDSRVISEFVLPTANARIDIAVINGHLHGYEIKSASDTLARLPDQITSYTKIFDFISVVTEGKYYGAIDNIMPPYVGIYVCYSNNKERIKEIRAPKLNPYRDGFHIAKLLWKPELIEVLKSNNIPFNSKDSSWNLCILLQKNLSVDEISKLVRHKLKAREDWRIKAIDTAG